MQRKLTGNKGVEYFVFCVCLFVVAIGARESAFRNIKTIAECLADELINAAKVALL